MNERPILFSSEMVRAILEGRKTMTRRIVKAKANILNDSQLTTYQPVSPHVYGFGTTTLGIKCDGGIVQIMGKCPYGKPGDRLWVRETWATVRLEYNYEVTYALDDVVDLRGQKPGAGSLGCYLAGAGPVKERTFYLADGDDYYDAAERGFRWRPSIHMPRWASRILLEVVSVRVERVQDISEADALAEGCVDWVESARDAYHELWNSLYTKEPEKQWDANPYVWCIEFKRVQP